MEPGAADAIIVVAQTELDAADELLRGVSMHVLDGSVTQAAVAARLSNLAQAYGNLREAQNYIKTALEQASKVCLSCDVCASSVSLRVSVRRALAVGTDAARRWS
jgi:hypothetical protein